MLEYLFGDTPQVEAIEKIIKSNDDCNTFPSKEEINTSNIDTDLKKFLKKHFEFPSNNINDIKDFISEDSKLEAIILDLPKIISKEFPQCPVFVDFMKYTLPDEIVLEISIKTPFNGEISSAKKDLILDEILKNYERPDKDYFISIEF